MPMSIGSALQVHVEAVTAMVERDMPVIEEVARRIAASFEAGGKLLVCGNGGSAADSQHFVAEFVNRMRFDRPPLPAIALSTDSSVMTSIANDAQYNEVFVRQVVALGHPEDVLVCFTTSGRSPNVLAALEAGSAKGMTTLVFTGATGGEALRGGCDIVLAVPSDDTPRIQECHEFAYHVIADLVERKLFGEVVGEAGPSR